MSKKGPTRISPTPDIIQKLNLGQSRKKINKKQFNSEEETMQK